ncbi:MAG: hypothetical protein EBQ92_03695 [Proteobacteria bacterium]|nr:hypothetical protein [Pseudomonadota bacterium]
MANVNTPSAVPFSLKTPLANLSGSQFIFWDIENKKGWRYDLDSGSWYPLPNKGAPNLSPRNLDPQMIAIGDKTVLGFGLERASNKSSVVPVTKASVYDPKLDKWFPLLEKNVPRNCAGKYLATGSQLFYYGGTESCGYQPSSNGGFYNFPKGVSDANP